MRFNSLMDNKTGNSQLDNKTLFDASPLYADLAPLVFDSNELLVDSAAPSFVKASAFANALDNLGHDLKLPMYLRDVGISSTDVDKLASEAMKQTRLLPNNPREVTLKDAVDLYTRAF
jgi:alcohol dehydrogenase class IV